jgi:hypothetical protein
MILGRVWTCNCDARGGARVVILTIERADGVFIERENHLNTHKDSRKQILVPCPSSNTNRQARMLVSMTSGAN